MLVLAADKRQESLQTFPWGHKPWEDYTPIPGNHEEYDLPHLHDELPTNQWKQNLIERVGTRPKEEVDPADPSSYPSSYVGTSPFIDYGNEPVPEGMNVKKYFTPTNPIIGYNVYLNAANDQAIRRASSSHSRRPAVRDPSLQASTSSEPLRVVIRNEDVPMIDLTIPYSTPSAGWCEVADKKDIQRVTKMMHAQWKFPNTKNSLLQSALRVREVITPTLARAILDNSTPYQDLAIIAKKTAPRADMEVCMQARLIRQELLQRVVLDPERASVLCLEAIFFEGMKNRPTRDVVNHIIFKITKPKEYLDRQNFIVDPSTSTRQQHGPRK